MEDGAGDSLRAGRSRPPPFYRTIWRMPLERPLATVSPDNTVANRLPGLAGDSLKRFIRANKQFCLEEASQHVLYTVPRLYQLA
jgi:hypothetical protein